MARTSFESITNCCDSGIKETFVAENVRGACIACSDVLGPQEPRVSRESSEASEASYV